MTTNSLLSYVFASKQSCSQRAVFTNVRQRCVKNVGHGNII
uniref:Uncharacterized protein n=1 Tax=Anguilla anguilla TaxID=7936 RepID=A0A0E9TYG6_ANGAN